MRSISGEGGRGRLKKEEPTTGGRRKWKWGGEKTEEAQIQGAISRKYFHEESTIYIGKDKRKVKGSVLEWRTLSSWLSGGKLAR